MDSIGVGEKTNSLRLLGKNYKFWSRFLFFMTASREILVRGRKDLTEGKGLVRETVEAIGRAVDEELMALDTADLLDDPIMPVREA
jgi:hypothetical protein